VEKDREKGGGLNGCPEYLHLSFIQGRIFPSAGVSGEELDGLTAPYTGSFNYL
jgi:hypothetical protein